MKTILSVYKPIGKTPLEMIEEVKKRFPEYKDQSITYAGRLDPMAHGVLLLVIGDAIKQKEHFLHLSKHYVFEVLFGLETDSYDVLGLVTNANRDEASISKSFVNSFVNRYIGKQTIIYPPFSSKTVQGKPLFQWTKEGRLNEITLPTKEIYIDAFSMISFATVSQDHLKMKVMHHISLVKGDFRQEEIKTRWNTVFANDHKQFVTATFAIACSSGTYVRGIAHQLGKELGCGAIALDIFRTKVGAYSIEDSIRM